LHLCFVLKSNKLQINNQIVTNLQQIKKYNHRLILLFSLPNFHNNVYHNACVINSHSKNRNKLLSLIVIGYMPGFISSLICFQDGHQRQQFFRVERQVAFSASAVQIRSVYSRTTVYQNIILVTWNCYKLLVTLKYQLKKWTCCVIGKHLYTLV